MLPIGNVTIGKMGGSNIITGQRAKNPPSCARLGNAMEMPFSGDYAIREALSMHRHHEATVFQRCVVSRRWVECY